MKKLLLPSFLALSLFAACGGGAAASAAGTYQLDVDTLFTAMSAEMKDAPKEIVAEMKKKMSGAIELKADHTATFTIDMGVPMLPKTTSSGTWKLDGTTLSMTTKKGDKDETKAATLEHGKITISEEQGGKKMQMTFVKK